MEDLTDLEWHELNSVRGRGGNMAKSEIEGNFALRFSVCVA